MNKQNNNMFKDKIEDLKKRIESIITRKDLPALISERDTLESQTSDANFWSDNEKAQKIMQEIGGLKSEISEIENLQKKVDDLISISTEEISEDDTDLVKMVEDGISDLEKDIE